MDYDFMYTNEVIDMSPKEAVPTVCIERITPETARHYLMQSAGNRNLKPAKIYSLTRDMKAGKFKLNGESIIFDANGTLLDGHHRLTACSRSEMTISSVVVRNVISETQKTIDTGSSRSISDHLKLGGYAQSTVLAATVSLLITLKKGYIAPSTSTSIEVFEFIEKYPQVVISVHELQKAYFPRIASVFKAIHFAATLNGEEDIALSFVRVFKTGIPAYKGCAAHMLRDRIMREEAKGRPTTITDIKRITIKAWELFRIGKTIGVLRASNSTHLSGWTEV